MQKNLEDELNKKLVEESEKEKKGARSWLEAAIESSSIILKSSEKKAKDFLNRLTSPTKRAVVTALELSGESLLFFSSKRYWRYCVTAMWRFYWALVLDREPLSEDLATIAALYYRSRDALPAAKKLINELKKDWRIEPEVIEKENFPFNPKQSEKIEPNTLKFLRFATKDLIDLYKQENLPSVCLAHHKVHWAGCPVCEKED